MTDLKITQQQTKLKVLLIGDSCIDEYKIGTVDRVSPEAPVPIIKLVDQYSLPGMSANVKKNLEALDIIPDFVTNTTEIVKTRYIDKRSGQHMLRVDTEPKVTQWDGKTPNPIELYNAIIISDYNKGFLSYENIESIIQSTNGYVFIDTKKQDLSRFSADWTFVKINELEYKNRNNDPKNLIVTLGGDGAKFCQYDKKVHFLAKKVDVVDVCGCGDTFLSALAYRFLCTNNIENAIIFANTAASITVQRRGNYAPNLTEITNGY
jgi:D-beta-D-heptose 7-phosphate kinase/D-beta-D-heptose 1-phosphate adenosyltransferase